MGNSKLGLGMPTPNVLHACCCGPLSAAAAALVVCGGNNVLFGGRINKLGLGSESWRCPLPSAVACAAAAVAAAVPGKAHNSSFYLWDFGMACQSCVCDTLLPLIPSAPPTPTRPPAWAFVTLSIPTLINGFVFSFSLSLSVAQSLTLYSLSFSSADDACWPCLRVLNVGAATESDTENLPSSN